MAANGTDETTAENWSDRIEGRLSAVEFEVAAWQSATGHKTPAGYCVERNRHLDLSIAEGEASLYEQACHAENMAGHKKTHMMLDLLIRKASKMEGATP